MLDLSAAATRLRWQIVCPLQARWTLIRLEVRQIEVALVNRGGSQMISIRALMFTSIGLCLFANSAAPQTAQRPPQQAAPSAPLTADDVWTIPDRDRINEGTVTVITAPAGGATSIFGSDLARVLDDDATIRVLPILGKGPVRNVVDILYLKSIDMGAVAADVPEFHRLQYNIPDITSKLRYIAKLYHNEIHIIATQAIKSISDLQGKRII